MKSIISAALAASIFLIQPMDAAQMLPVLEGTQNPSQFMQETLCPTGSFDVEAARRLLLQLKREARAQYNIDMDLQTIADEAIRAMQETGKFSQEEIETAETFYRRLIGSNERIFYSLGGQKKQPELILPDDMALGFMLVFGGSIMCVLPFGITQAIGTGCISSGIALVAQSASRGDKPYYIDRETGNPIPPTNQTGPSIGVGKDF